ncbi:hypothetical protein TCAL_15814 [Tigriopus californicus]|uniref:Uncharacterized protein n=1 Tax=Tigriopus californicus TaxID=6832 RepID=A0A553NR58_TIGCA|nr:hypothetical protein TCAL_15814 [Tigriopus californicus]
MLVGGLIFPIAWTGAQLSWASSFFSSCPCSTKPPFTLKVRGLDWNLWTHSDRIVVCRGSLRFIAGNPKVCCTMVKEEGSFHEFLRKHDPRSPQNVAPSEMVSSLNTFPNLSIAHCGIVAHSEYTFLVLLVPYPFVWRHQLWTNLAPGKRLHLMSARIEPGLVPLKIGTSGLWSVIT